MAQNTKVRSLVVRPRESASLAFPVAGVIEKIAVTLGDEVDGQRVFDEDRDWRDHRGPTSPLDLAISPLAEKAVARLRLNTALSAARRAQNGGGNPDGYRIALDELRELFLTSPIQGQVTRVLKAEGEFVRPGEPVIRVESAHRIELVGQIHHRGRIGVGWRGILRTKRLFRTDIQAQWPVRVLSVRGRGPEDDEWDVILLVEGSNTTRSWTPAPATRRDHGLPLDYHFGTEAELALSP